MSISLIFLQTLEIELSIIDKDILEWLIQEIDERKEPGRASMIGVGMTLHNLETGNKLLDTNIHPNVQYEYNVPNAGTYKLCVVLADMVFEKYDKVKTNVRFNTEFHRSKYAGN